MIINRNFFSKLILVASLTFVSLITSAQGYVCRESYNNALKFYNAGQYENINNYLKSCIENIRNVDNQNYYKSNSYGTIRLFKVYKICINSFRNLDQRNLAEQKMVELVSYLNWARADVEKRLNETPLTEID